MTVSAILLAVTGVVLTFLPAEIALAFGFTTNTKIEHVLFQILGAAYFAFGMINWTAKANLIGGIYGRPIAIGNLTHFVIGALALIKMYASTQQTVLLLPSVVYAVFALLFTILFFTHPVQPQKQ
jgi:hypothetical protein